MVIEELLGAYALNAVEDDERQLVEAHLSECQACRNEVRDHREVAALLVGDPAPPPERVWNGILAEIEPVVAPDDLAQVVSLRPRRRLFEMTATGWAVSVAAAVAVAALSAALVTQSSRIGDLNDQVIAQEQQIAVLVSDLQADPLQQAVSAALTDPGARVANLTAEDTEAGMLVVVLPDGTGYLFQSTLKALSEDSTYQLWAVVDGKVISAGVLGRNPGIVPFHIDPEGLQGLVITEEVAGGVSRSEADPTVAWFEA